MTKDRQQNLDKFQLSLYMMPFLGPIWAWINLSNKSNLDGEEKKVSRLSIRIGLVWLLAYSTLWLGGSITSDIWSIRLLYLNGIITTTYLIACFLLVSRLWNKKSQ